MDEKSLLGKYPAAQHKFFVLDRDIEDRNDDRFDHLSLAETISRVMEEYQAPFAIGLFGRWGLGKSTLANVLRQHLAGDDTKWVKVNLWNHNEVTLPQASYREVMRDIVGEAAINKEISTKKTLTGIETGWKPVIFQMYAYAVSLGPAGITYLIIASLAYLVYTGVTSETATLSGWMEALSTNAWYMFAMALTKHLLDQSKFSERKMEISPPGSLDYYADRFRQETQSFKRVIVLVDDIDRLEGKEMIKALEIMKAYMNSRGNNCIYLILCDDTVVRRALTQHKELSADEAEGFISKFFQFAFRLPPQVPSDLRTFAFQVLQTVGSPLLSLSGFQETVLPLLIHSDVATPRHVKRLINEFSAVYLMLKLREENGHLPLSFADSPKNLEFASKLAVLRSDFPEFYGQLENEPGLLADVEALLEGGEVPPERQVKARTAIGQHQNPLSPEDDYRAQRLVRVLNRFSHVQVSDIRPFLFHKASAVHLLLPDGASLRLALELTSGNTAAVRTILSRLGNKIDEGFRAALSILEKSHSVDLGKGIKVLCELADQLPQLEPELAIKVADFVVKRGRILPVSLFPNPKQTCFLLGHASDTVSRDRFLDFCLDQLDRNKGENRQRLISWLQEIVNARSLWRNNRPAGGGLQRIIAQLDSDDLAYLLSTQRVDGALCLLTGQDALVQLCSLALKQDSSETDSGGIVELVGNRVLPVMADVYDQAAGEVWIQCLRRGKRLFTLAPNTTVGHRVVEAISVTCSRVVELGNSGVARRMLEWSFRLLRIVSPVSKERTEAEFAIVRVIELLADVLDPDFFLDFSSRLREAVSAANARRIDVLMQATATSELRQLA